MRQRRQIAGSPKGALLRDKSGHTFVQHIHHGLHRLQADTGKSFYKVIDPQKHDPSGNIFAKGISCTYRMGNDQIFLEGLALVLRNHHITEFAESGSNSVHDLFLFHQLIHDLPGCKDLALCFLRQFNFGMPPADGCDLI